MATTEMQIGLTNSARPSSRVLKPPGGGHSNIFAEPEVSVNAPRPKYNQQNSSNLNACMGSTDPNIVVEKMRDEVQHKKETPEPKASNEEGKTATANGGGGAAAANDGGANARSRVPPGGFSSGSFW